MRNREGRSSKLRIGLKYCGGCRSQYNRVAVVKKLMERLEKQVEFVSYAEHAVDGYLIVVGCATACVDREPFSDKPIWMISTPDEAERFFGEMMKEVEDKDALERTVQK